jgi:cytochrome P450
VVHVDLTDLELFATGDPHAAWRHLRATDPVSWHHESDGPGFWALVKYADIISVYRDHASFTSERGMLLGVNRGEGDPAAGQMLVVTDPPRHGQLRAIILHAFAARSVAAMRDQVAGVVTAILDHQNDAYDFATEVAARLPVAVICDLMGIPKVEWDRVLTWTNQAFLASDPEYLTQATARASAARARREIFSTCADLMLERRACPRDDLIGVMANAEIEGRRLTDQEVLLNCLNILIGANETTRHTASGGLLALLSHQDELRRLRLDPSLLPTAIEEMLRWTTPAQYVLRTATKTVRIRDREIRVGDAVTLWNPSGNRDEDVFEAPDRFEIGRVPNRHLSFGYGEHFCVGAALARLELTLLFEQLLASTTSIELDAPVVRLRSNAVGGIKHMPVTVTRR